MAAIEDRSRMVWEGKITKGPSKWGLLIEGHGLGGEVAFTAHALLDDTPITFRALIATVGVAQGRQADRQHWKVDGYVRRQEPIIRADMPFHAYYDSHKREGNIRIDAD